MTLGSLRRHRVRRFPKIPRRSRRERVVSRPGPGAVGSRRVVDPSQARARAIHRRPVRHRLTLVSRARVGTHRYTGTHPELDLNRAANPKLNSEPFRYSHTRPKGDVEASDYSKVSDGCTGKRTTQMGSVAKLTQSTV